jgi:uncharacterized SAM-binding protein YcdF (DUF218 family)
MRLLVVLGYSDGGAELHEICARRLRRAEREAAASDVVLLSGAPEADHMARAWRGACRRLVLDRSARSTFGNAVGTAVLARRLGADEVVLVTSGWHARRARALLRLALGGGPAVMLATTDEQPSLQARLRELACWAQVPLAALSAPAPRP